MTDRTDTTDPLPSLYEVLAHRTREQLIDAWMEDKLFLQGQVKRLQGIIRELHSLHVNAEARFISASQDVVLS